MRGSKGEVCWSLQREPEMTPPRPLDDQLSYQGRRPSCRGGNVIPSLTGHIEQSRNFPYNTIAGLARPDVKAITAEFDDGGMESVALGGETFVVFYQPARAFRNLHVELLDGRTRCVGVRFDLGKSDDPDWVPLRLECDR